MLKTESLSFTFDGSSYFNFPDIELADREDLLILGESGIGKTTLLHLMAGILKPDSGRIMINETDITQLRNRETDHFRGKNLGIVFQKPHFIRSLNLIEHLLLIQHLSGKKDIRRVHNVLHRLGLENKEKAYPRKLSEGEKQRFSIAMALINRTQILLADEPTSSLDDRNCFQGS
jgi:ABC-type lipoprotein export system ATPase subunit